MTRGSIQKYVKEVTNLKIINSINSKKLKKYILDVIFYINSKFISLNIFLKISKNYGTHIVRDLNLLKIICLKDKLNSRCNIWYIAHIIRDLISLLCDLHNVSQFQFLRPNSINSISKAAIGTHVVLN